LTEEANIATPTPPKETPVVAPPKITPVTPLAAALALAKKVRPQIWIAGGAVVLLLGVTLTCVFSGGSGYDADLMKSNPGLGLTRMAAVLHPDWQVASTTDHNIALIDKSTGKPVTFKLDPDQKTLVVTAAEVPVATAAPVTAEVPVQDSRAPGSVPSWVPSYPGSTPELKSFAQTPLDGEQSIFTFKTTDSPAKVIMYYQDQIKAAGFKVTVASSGEQGGMVQAEDLQKKRSIIVGVEDSGEGTKARLVVVEKK
jgi:hypothetical protein